MAEDNVNAFRKQISDYFWLRYLGGRAAWYGSIVLRMGPSD
jgi:hypothetical protein